MVAFSKSRDRFIQVLHVIETLAQEQAVHMCCIKGAAKGVRAETLQSIAYSPVRPAHHAVPNFKSRVFKECFNP